MLWWLITGTFISLEFIGILSALPLITIILIEIFRLCVGYVTDDHRDCLEYDGIPLVGYALFFGCSHFVLMAGLGWFLHILIIVGILMYCLLRIIRFCFRVQKSHSELNF